MIYRQKILLSLIQETEVPFTVEKLQLLMFLFCNEFSENNLYYDFVPSKGGPVSLTLEKDKAGLTKKKILLCDQDNISTAQDAKRFALGLDLFEKMALARLKNQVSNLTNEELLVRIYTQKPYYAIFDDRAKALLNNEQYKQVEAEKPKETGSVFYTIGYEGISPEEYLNRLIKNDVKLLCDVRKNAYSQKYGFSKRELENLLKVAGIKYLHIPELGIISEKRQTLESAQDYRILFDEYEKTTLVENQNKLDELIGLLQANNRIAITCFEKDVHSCHRGCIASTLKSRSDFNFDIKNI